SMAREVFVDSSGLYALADHRDPFRAAAERCVSALLKSGGGLILTDYIIDEACTLAKARAGAYGALRLLEIVNRSEGFRLIWIGEERFEATKLFFRKHADHGYSFTDCTSFVVMRELEITDALTADRHFSEAGFRPLLPVV
ncbi:MAG: PIN domain-containing protein, partial [Verrucomicrobiota bacterium]|nr:PIN domain-containing protein [Verrucomicrobiota bacterium]